jgi:hypothetical protein
MPVAFILRRSPAIGTPTQAEHKRRSNTHLAQFPPSNCTRCTASVAWPGSALRSSQRVLCPDYSAKPNLPDSDGWAAARALPGRTRRRAYAGARITPAAP